MNKIKSRLAMLLAVILITGSLQGPVFAVQSGQRGRDAGVSAQKGTVDPDQVTQTEPLDLEPEEDTPEDPPEEEFYTVTVEMDGGYGGVYHGSIFDDAIGDYVTDASSFVKKVKKGEAVEFMQGSLYIGGEHQHDFLGWSLEPGGELVGTQTSYTPTGDCTLYANWTSHIAFVFTDDAHQDHFPDGSLGKTVYADRDGWVTLPEDPVSATPGWRFYRWIWSDSTEDVEVVDGRVHIDYTRTLNPDWRDIKIETITLDKSTLDLEIGETAQLNVTSILPEDALTKEITWQSDDEVTASVDETGAVTGLRRGTTTIRACAADGGGASALCTVNVDGGKTLVTFDANGGSFQGRFWDAQAEGYVEDPVSFSREDVGFGASFNSNETILHSDPSMRFRGWSLTVDGEPVIGKTENYKTDKNVTLYAVWEPVYVVTIDMNGGNYLGLVHDDALGQDVTSPDSFVWEVKKGQALAFEENRIYCSSDPDRAFIGWSLEQDGEIVGTKTGYTPEGDCTLHAVWTKAACFEPQGGSFEDGSASVRSMADENGFVDIPGMIPVCDDDNKIFGGWTLEEGGEPVEVSPEGKIQIEQDCTLIPVWTDKGSGQPEDPQEDTWTITIDCNGGYLPGTWFDDGKQENAVNPSSFVKIIKKGESLKLSLSGAWIDDPHKVIAGWSLEPGGSVAVYSATSYSYVPRQDCTLYAVWEDAYSVTLDLNGGYYTSSFWNGDTLEYESGLRERVVKVGCGYGVDFRASGIRHDDSSMQLTGWSLEKDGDIVSDEAGRYFPENDCTLYAVWGRSHLVTVDLGSGHFNVNKYDSVEGRYVNGESIWHARIGEGGRVELVRSQITPADSSLILVGWSLEPDGELILDRYASSYEIQEDCTLYAVYDHFHTVTVDYRFGRSGTSVFDDQTGSVRTDTDSYVKYVRQGEAMELYPDSAHYPVDYSPHDFGGWSLEQDGTLLEDNHSFTPTEDCTVYAVWTCHAIFRADGGRFPNGDLSVRADADRNSKVPVPEEIPAADDETKVFDGWCREGSTDKITVDQDGKTAIPYNVTFVPVWKDKPQDDPDENTWTVIFDANGGTFPNGETQISIEVEKGDWACFSKKPVTQEDKVFGGWTLEDGTFVEDASYYEPTGNETLYAVWSDYYTVTLDANGGTFPDGNIQILRKVIKGRTIKFYQEPQPSTEQEKVFVGWMLENGTAFEDVSYYEPTGDVTLYAVWSDYYTVTFDTAGGQLNYGDSHLVHKVAKGDSLHFGYLKAEYPDNSRLFMGWAEEGEEEPLEDQSIYVPQDNITLTAKWVDAAVITFDAEDEVGTFRIAYDDEICVGLDDQLDPIYEPTVSYRDCNPLTFYFPRDFSLFKAVEKEYHIDPYYCHFDDSHSFDAWYTTDEYGNESIEYFRFPTPKADDETLIFTGWSLPDGSFIAKDELKSFVPEGNTTLTAVWRKPAESLELSESSLTLNKGETAVLKASVQPEDFADKDVSWKSSDTAIATVDAEGNVKAVAKGTATITAATKDGTGISASCTVTVKQPVTGITLSKTTLSLMKGKTTTLTATAAPESADNKAVTWKSSNTKIATVDTNGLVKAVAKGTATITVTAKDGSGVSASCTVTVKQPVTKITLNKTALSLMKGKTSTLTATAAPASANNKAVTWKSSNTKIATVDTKGLVKAVAKGTATITATAKDGSGIKAVCKVTVKQPVTKITLNKTALSLMKGKTSTLTATAAPASANNKAVTWKSSNTKIATVDTKGLVKAVAKGTATITATAKDGSGIKAVCKVTVKQPVTKITLNKTVLSLTRGKTFTLKATAGPASANNKAVKWTTSNKAVATVTSNGVVKGIKGGTATITATAKDGSNKKVTCRVTVK